MKNWKRWQLLSKKIRLNLPKLQKVQKLQKVAKIHKVVDFRYIDALPNPVIAVLLPPQESYLLLFTCRFFQRKLEPRSKHCKLLMISPKPANFGKNWKDGRLITLIDTCRPTGDPHPPTSRQLQPFQKLKFCQKWRHFDIIGNS